MKSNKIRLTNFRKYCEEEIEFSDGINVICGDNAQGKTNILEAVHMFSMGKSNRTNKDSELIRHGEDKADIYMEFSSYSQDSFFEIEMFRGRRKTIIYNDIPIKRNSELLGKFNVVYFGPELLGLVKEGPRGRRRNLDMLISQLRPNYFSALSSLRKVVDSKNALLKMTSPNETLLEIMNEKLIQVSAEIIRYRAEFIRRIEEIAKDIQFEISSGAEELSLKYMSCIGRFSTDAEFDAADVTNRLREKISSSYKREMEYGETMVSPHREDIVFEINNRDAKAFASQGQQKTIVLVEKLAEVKLIKEDINETPVLLLDDIMSELDRKRQKFVLANIKDMQIIITCTDIEELIGSGESAFESINRIFIKDGKVVSSLS